jgi:hypothetical protein
MPGFALTAEKRWSLLQRWGMLGKISLVLFLAVTEKRKGNKDEISSLDYLVAGVVCVIASAQTCLPIIPR